MPAQACLLILLNAILGSTGDAVSCAPQEAVDLFGADRSEVYKTVGEVRLRLRLYLPDGHKESDRRPAIVFFFGGGWRGGSPSQFRNQARYLATRGMVAINADYRVHSTHAALVRDCISDARSALRWVRRHAARLGVDPDRIAAGGGSAGGHLAAATATIYSFDEPGEDKEISASPNALVLFNPALDLRLEAFNTTFQSQGYQEIAKRMGSDPQNLSPTLHVKKGTPPAIVFHGKDDATIPYAQAEAFRATLQAAGSRCELSGFDGQNHGFFNYGRSENRFYIETMRLADAFLISLGYLRGTPTIDSFVGSGGG